VGINVERAFHDEIDFNLDLQTLIDQAPDAVKALIGAGGVLEVSAGATGKLAFDAFGRFNLGFALDLADVLHPHFLVSDTSGIDFGVSVHNTEPLDFHASINVPVIGKVGLTIEDGSALLEANAHFGLLDE